MVLGALEEVQVDMMMQQEEVPDLWKKQFQEFLVKTILFLLRSQKHPSYVMARLMEVTMLTQKQNAKHSTFVPMMEMEDLQNTVSCVLMEHSSSSSILCVTGGLMWTVLLLSNYILLMMKLLLRELQILQLELAVITKVGLLEEEQVLEDVVEVA